MVEGHARMHAMKDALIDRLREDLDKERTRYADREKELLDKIVELMKPPAPPEKRSWFRRAGEEQPDTPPETLDLTQVDENDPEALMFLVKREIPLGMRANGGHLIQSAERLRQQIVAAKRERLKGYSTPAVVPVSAAVMQQIEEAESAGRAEAKAGA